MSAADNKPSLTDWHFPRKQVAESYLKTLSSGVLLSTTIYAPPKTGLTNFLINDVIPCAQNDKYVTIYVDLSDPNVPVTAAMMMGLERVLSGSSVFQTGFNFLKNIFQTKEASISRVEGYINKNKIIDIDFFVENKKYHLSLIDSYFNKILNYKSLIVLVDHAHHLGKDEIGREFSNYFRNLISTHSHAIRPLYATNNMASWAGVFENRHSPLHSEGAFVHKLMPLSKMYVREAITRLGQKVSMDEAVKCFEMTGARPGIFNALLLGWQKDLTVPLSNYFHQELEGRKAQKVIIPEFLEVISK